MTAAPAAPTVSGGHAPASPLVCVALAPALDRYYWLARLQVDSIHRPERVEAQAGGKGLHVAQVAHLLGADVRVVGILGGHTGAWIQSHASEFTTRSRWAWTNSETRQCLCVLDTAAGELTEFYEPIAPVSTAEWDELQTLLVAELIDARRTDRTGGGCDPLVAVSGRLPPGAPPDGIARIVELARSHGMHAVVDSAGESLRACISSRPWMLKINAAEAAELTGTPIRLPAEAASAGHALRALGVSHAIITLGEDGVVYNGPDSASLLVQAPSVRSPLAVGSGDTHLGALAAGIQSGRSLRDALVLATAAATANAENFLAGDISTDRVEELCSHTRITALD